MTDPQLTKWGERYGIKLGEVKELRRLVNKYAKQQEHASNGDRHPRVSEFADKNDHAQEWDKESETTATLLENYAKRLGFDGIDFGVGLYPAFIKDGDSCIHVPE